MMRTTLALFFALELICPAICSGQTKTELRDITAKSSPIHVSGSSVFEDDASTANYSYRVDGLVENRWGKGILLMLIHFANSGVNTPHLDFSYEQDYFFSSDILDPGKIEEFHSDRVRLARQSMNGQLALDDVEEGSGPLVTAQVIFVQFVDGKFWGDAAEGQKYLALRERTMRELHKLERVLADEGEEALKSAALASDPLLTGINSLNNICRDNTASCFANNLRSMMETAKQHEPHAKFVRRE